MSGGMMFRADFRPMHAQTFSENSGRVESLSATGCTILARCQPQPDAELELRLYLPDGDWPEWVTLRQAGHPPKGAVWVGLGLRVQNQVEGDWVEAKGFSLAELSATEH